VIGNDPQGRKAVHHAPAKANRAGLCKVAGRYWHLRNLKTSAHSLSDKLLIEHEIIAVLVVRQPLEETSTVGAEPRVVFGQSEAECEILESGQEPIAYVFPTRHATRERVAQEPATERQVRRTVENRRNESGNSRCVVLIVRMKHDDDLGTDLESTVIACLLVAAVPAVLLVDDDVEAQVLRDFDRLVLGNVVDQDDVIHQVVRDIVVRALERLGGVVGGHHDGDRRFGLASLRTLDLVHTATNVLCFTVRIVVSPPPSWAHLAA
jgi:hypothetical protein